MYTKNIVTTLFLALIIASCAPEGEASARVDWDEWGVPHVTANTAEDLFYAQGWAQMHNHANLILRLYGRSERSNTGREHASRHKLVQTPFRGVGRRVRRNRPETKAFECLWME